MDCLVNLYSRRMTALAERVGNVEATIRVALPPELHIVQRWVRENFSEYWVSEVTVAMAHQPPGCLIAIVDGQLVGFACYDATARGFFGPTGVSESQRGKNIGLALLSHSGRDEGSGLCLCHYRLGRSGGLLRQCGGSNSNQGGQGRYLSGTAARPTQSRGWRLVPSSTPLALFVGMPGLGLSADQVAFFREANPFGLFLFRRNLDNPEQVRRLCARFREAVGRADAPVFIDQEGGRVQRLNNGTWPSFRSLGEFGALARRDLELGKQAMRLSTQAMATLMAELTIDSGTTPVVDLARKGTHEVIGQRAFGDDPHLVITMAREIIDAMLEAGELPVIKHIPGYGRVTVDPHFDCPVVDAGLEDLRATDFQPFIALKHTPWAMVAHLIFTQIDPERPASVSPLVCELIREDIGYDGVLITDCLSMEALQGSPSERVAAALDAGYDIALYSQGDLATAQAIAKAARPLSSQSLERIARSQAIRGAKRVDIAALHAEVERIFKENGFA